MPLFVRGNERLADLGLTHSTFHVPHRPPGRGFTLIEVLVVLVILGVAVAMIGVNFAPDPRQSLGTEAHRLALLLQQARDEAMSTGSSIAFSTESRQYRFWKRQATPGGEATQWMEHADKELFRARSLPEGITVSELRVNQQAADGDTPKIIFTASGMMLPFRLVLASGPHHLAITGNGMGEIREE